MGITKEKTKLQRKKEEKIKRDYAVALALKKAKRTARQANVSGPKRKSADSLLAYIGAIHVPHTSVRNIDTFRCSAYSLEKQVRALVDHLYVKYLVPEFLYPCMYSAQGKILVLRMLPKYASMTQKRELLRLEQSLFLACAGGSSLVPLLKQWLTKKEVHLFMQAPATQSTGENLLWAKLKCAGVRDEWLETLVKQFAQRAWKRGLGTPFVSDLCRVFANKSYKLSDRQFRSLIDYLAHVATDEEYSLKGRTLESLFKASADWHRRNAWGQVVKFETWASRYALWSDNHQGLHVRVIELTNNRMLHDETYEQDHCVFSYEAMCRSGQCRILSVRWYRLDNGMATAIVNRITFEVDSALNQIVQIRGKHNRQVTKVEMEVIRKWAGMNGVLIAKYAI